MSKHKTNQCFYNWFLWLVFSYRQHFATKFPLVVLENYKWKSFMDGKKSQQNTCSFVDPLHTYCHLQLVCN
jgi:hypothetical protein